MNRSPTYIVPLLVAAVLVLGVSNVHAQPEAAPPGMIDKEPELRAKLVALQSRLWTWPPAAAPSAGTPYKIGILGNDPFQLDKRLAADKNIEVSRLANVAAITPCHILVVSQPSDLKEALEKTQGENVLVITQEPGLAKQGAVLNLPVVQNKIKMEINLSAAKKAGLTPHPGLLRIAKIVQ